MIPVYINCRNRLTTTKRLAEQCSCIADAVPIIVDNASDWPPLIEWLQRCPFEVIHVGENGGHHAPWRFIDEEAEFAKRWGQSRYVVTDCDLDLRDVPADVLDVLSEPFSWGQSIVKSGLSLRIDDLPAWQSTVVEWESQWWQKPTREGRFFWAAVDTTFLMLDATTLHSIATTVVGVKSVRSAPPYCARHVPWYLDGDNLDAENEHYFRTANASNSWKPRGRSLVSRYS